MKIFALELCSSPSLRWTRSSLRLVFAPLKRSASASFCFNSCSRASMRAVSSARANATSRRVLHLCQDAFLLSFLGSFFLPASCTHQHVTGSRVNIGQGDSFIAQDEFAHLVECLYHAI